MKELNLYEQAGIVTPGAVFLFGLTLVVPALSPFLKGNNVTLGDLGLFLILSYAAGHAVAAFGNLVEYLFWKLFGGMPTAWITLDPPKLLSAQQVRQVQSNVAEHLGLECPPVNAIKADKWKPIFAQIYRYVLINQPNRLEIFNANYGLNRGLAAASLILCAASLFLADAAVRTRFALAFAGLFVIYVIRMYRFGIHFAREVYVAFLVGTPASAKSTAG